MAAATTLMNSLTRLKSIVQVQIQKFSEWSSKAKDKVKAPVELRNKPMAAEPSADIDTSKWNKVHAKSPETTSSTIPDSPKIVHKLLQNKAAIDASKWKKMHARSLGITSSMIPDSPKIVLRLLQSEGHDAYLVGGCVRDLLLNKIPKDFDVITSANLKEIKRKFHRSFIIGRRFPICKVYVRGTAIEVSSFETVAKNATEKEDVHFNDLPGGYDTKDFMRWRNSLKRDFTINSLFYDPFAQRVYDYSNGMTDLKAMKLRTLVPAHVSFEEDCARILRGIRIAARLGLSIAKDTDKAIQSLHSSITNLDKGRLMMELNFMLSYGAAKPSILLLKKFGILELLLPLHAAYLAERSGTESPIMLLRLFYNLDSLTSCDQPCESVLWVSLLAFHLALVNKPQDAIVVWMFSSLLYHGNWQKSVEIARKHSARHYHFTPEILKSLSDVTDEELSRRVTSFSSTILDSLDILTNPESLSTAMSRYPSLSSSELVFIGRYTADAVFATLKMFRNDLESLSEERPHFNIDYNLLGKGDIPETRFVFGKIIMDTMKSGVIEEKPKVATKKDHKSSISKLKTAKGNEKTKRGRTVVDDKKHQQKAKKQKPEKQKNNLDEILSCEDIGQKRQQLKKVVVKDVETLLSMNEVILEEVQSEPEKDHFETQSAKEMLDVLGQISVSKKQFTAQPPEKILSVLEKGPQMNIQRKEQIPTDARNVSSLSNIFVEDNYRTKTDRKEKQPTKTDDRREKQATSKDSSRKKSKGKNTVTKKQRTTQPPENVLSDLEEVPQMKIQQKEQIPMDARDAPKLSNFFEEDDYPTKTGDRKEKQSTKTDDKKEKQPTKTVDRREKQATLSDSPRKKSKGQTTVTKKQHTTQPPEKILSVLEKAPRLKLQQKEQISTDDRNVPNLSNIFQGDEHPTMTDDRIEKQATLSDSPKNKSVEVKKARKLSGFFK